MSNIKGNFLDVKKPPNLVGGFFISLRGLIFIFLYMISATNAFADVQDGEINEVLNDISKKYPKIEIYVHNNPIRTELTQGQYGKGKSYEPYDIIHKDDLLKTLKNIRGALEKRRWFGYDRDENTMSVHITNRYLSDYSGYSKNVYISIAEPVERIVFALSGAPKKEPEFETYLAKNKESLSKFLESDSEIHEAFMELLCNKPSYRNLSEQDLQNYFEGYEIEFQSGTETIKVWKKGKSNKNLAFTDAFSADTFRLEISGYKIKIASNDSFNDVEITAQDDSGQTRVSRVRYDADCNAISGKTEFINHLGKVERVKRLKRDGTLHSTYMEREVFSLEQIYTECHQLPGNKTLEELLSIAKQVDRIGVAIVDSGVDYNHPDLAYKISRSSNERKSGELSMGWDVVQGNAKPYDYTIRPTIGEGRKAAQNHGTHVAGIAAQGNDRIEIIPIRIGFSESIVGDKPNTSENLTEDQRLDAIKIAAEKGARIVNLSLTVSPYMFKGLASKYPNILFVKAAGNGGKGSYSKHDLSFDAPPENVIVVAASNVEDELADFSSYSEVGVHLAALGVQVHSTLPEKTYGQISGTSMAAPQVTNVAAKILAINPRLSAKEVKAIILSTVKQVPSLKGKVATGGVLDQAAAIEKAKESLH